MKKILRGAALAVMTLVGGFSTSLLADAAYQDDAALAALQSAQRMTKAANNRWEYCGLIVRKVDGTYRASVVQTSKLKTFCGASVNYRQGESIVAYYHTHPDGVEPYFSPEDIEEAQKKNWDYYLMGSDGRAQRYELSTGETVYLDEL